MGAYSGSIYTWSIIITMRYKTKKYIRKVVLYTLNTSIVIIIYVFAAHKMYLPAIFEYYTGDKVRELTLTTYEMYFDTTGVTQDNVAGESVDYMNWLDFAVREPTYLYISDMVSTSQTNGYVVNFMHDKAFAITTHPAMIEWLKNPKSQYSSVYQSECIRFIDGLNLYTTYAILNQKNVIMHSRGKITSREIEESDHAQTLHGVISIPIIYQGKALGRFYALAGNESNVNYRIAETGLGISMVTLQPDNKILQREVYGEYLNQWIKDNIYLGPHSGIHDGYRYVHKQTIKNSFVFIYKAQSLLYYVSKVIMYIIVVSFAIGLILILKSGAWKSRIHRKKAIDFDDLLYQSNKITQDYAGLAVKFQTSLQQAKSQELERLRIIGEHLGFLQQSIYNTVEEDQFKFKSLD